MPPTTAQICAATHPNVGGATVTDYIPHHEPFQYYASTANPMHLPPTSPPAGQPPLGETRAAPTIWAVPDHADDTPSPRPTLLLIDGHALVYRAFFAMPALTNSRGELTNAAYGFTSMLLKAFTECRPACAIAAFDPPGPTFRHQEMAAYKAQRPEMPADLRPQVRWARDIVAALGIPEVEIPTYEADDVIGSLSVKAVAAGLDVIIVTGDIDTLQLVNPQVRVFINRRGISDTVVYDVDAVRERFGFEPPLVADYKALQGDPSDNIPGIPGVGEKTAMSLIHEHGPLEAILEAVPRMKPGRLRTNLAEHADQARLSKRMATIQTDLDVPLDLERARVGGYDQAEVHALFDRLEFRSLLPRLGEALGYGTAPVTGPPGQGELTFGDSAQPTGEVVIAASADQVAELLAAVRGAGRAAIRTVTAGPARTGAVLGVAVAPIGSARGWWVALPQHRDAIAGLLGDPALVFDSYDLKRECLAWGPELRAGLGFDAMLAAYVDNPRSRVLSLSGLAADLCGARIETEDELLGSGRQRRRLEDLPDAELAAHFGRWVGLVEPVHAVLVKQLAASGLLAVHDELELPLVPILAAMERVGILLDREALGAIAAEMQARIGALEGEVHERAGHPFNLGSTQQLATVLYDELGLAAGRKTKFGRSTDADSLEALREEHPVVDLVLEWRQLSKLKSTYVDALPPALRPRRAGPHLLQPGGGGDRPALLGGPQPPERPHPHRVGPAHPPGLRRRLRPGAGLRRLLPGRAAGARPRHRRGGADPGLRPRRGHPPPHRRPGLRDRPRGGDPRHAPGRQGRQLRGGVRALRLRPGPGHRDVPGGGGRLHPLLLRELPGGDPLAGADPDARPRVGLGGDLHRAPPPSARHPRRQPPAPPRRRADGGQHAHPGRRRRDHEEGDDRLRPGPAARAARPPSVLLQVHDELVIEVPREEVPALVPLVRRAMSEAYPLVVPLVVDVKIGENWQEMTPGGGAGLTRHPSRA